MKPPNDNGLGSEVSAPGPDNDAAAWRHPGTTSRPSMCQATDSFVVKSDDYQKPKRAGKSEPSTNRDIPSLSEEMINEHIVVRIDAKPIHRL